MKILIIALALLVVLTITTPAQAKCKKHIVLHPASVIAQEYGISVMQATGMELNVWEKSNAEGKGRVVGKIRVGSHALILKEGKNSYKIKSPLDKSVGWISKIQVARTLTQDTVTRKACK